jgi:uncharacterized glyoxalase superfamily protein PhnB
MTLQGRLRRSTPVLLVDDIAATMRWYRANLGFKGDAVPESPPHAFGILIRDDIEVMLQQLAGYEKPELYERREGGVWDVYIRMEGVSALYESMLKRGDVTMVAPLCEQEYGETDFIIRDPNGYVLVFAEPTRRKE